MREFLLQHAGMDPVSFHMPGHKGSAIFRKYGYGGFLDRLIDCDITEIPGADNLFQAEGIIMETQEKYARLYGVEHSYLLINGTSGGLVASILATVKSGGKLIMARNCHKSVFNALTLGDIKPVYARPELVEEYGISGAIAPEEIKRMVKDMNFDIEIVGCPTVREDDGLAKSSRNSYLNERERAAATVLYRSMERAKAMAKEGVSDASQLLEAMRDVVSSEPLARIDYIEAVDGETLMPKEKLAAGDLVAMAVYIGSTRLIDNFTVGA